MKITKLNLTIERRNSLVIGGLLSELAFESKRESVREKKKGFNRRKSAAGGGAWIGEQRKRSRLEKSVEVERVYERGSGR